MSKNEYGLDVGYMEGKLNLFLRAIDYHTPAEAARVLARLAKAADENVLLENEFSQRDTYRDLCGELLGVIKKAQEDVNWMTNSEKLLNRDVFEYIDESITKAESILGEKNGTAN